MYCCYGKISGKVGQKNMISYNGGIHIVLMFLRYVLKTDRKFLNGGAAGGVSAIIMDVFIQYATISFNSSKKF